MSTERKKPDDCLHFTVSRYFKTLPGTDNITNEPAGWFCDECGTQMFEAALESTEPAHQLQRALSVKRHRLERVDEDQVECCCGDYAAPDAGKRHAERWRQHLIDVAVAAVEEPSR